MSNDKANPGRRWLTALLLLSATTLAQAQNPRDYRDGVLVCEMPPGGYFTAADEERIQATMRSMQASLAESEDPNQRVANVLLTANRTSRIDSLVQITEAFPDSRYAAVQAFNACYSNPGHAACVSDAMPDRAAELDRDNGALWYMLAAWRYRRGDEFGVSAAFRAALNARTFDDYFQYQLEAMNSALPELDDDIAIAIFVEILNSATTASLINYNSLPGFCQTRSTVNPDLSNLCLRLGERIEAESGALVSRMLGAALQSVVYRAIGDSVNAEKFDRADWLRQPQEEATAALQLMVHDADLARLWFERLIASGETAAMEAVFQEARRRSVDPQYYPCRL
jgi:hypothetical protein